MKMIRAAARLCLTLLGLLQLLSLLRVMSRFLRTARGETISPATRVDAEQRASVTIIVPVLNEFHRLRPCLEGLLLQGPEVAEILLVDGGSGDGTRALVDAYARRDHRLRLVDASPVPARWNGKSWGLHRGLTEAADSARWVLTLDADVAPTAHLTRSLLAHAEGQGLDALSIATRQDLADAPLGLLHPSLLTTLVYRYGLPGQICQTPDQTQANGQCMLLHRAALIQAGGFRLAWDSLCEDVTLARALVLAGYTVGFYEAGDLVSVRMYENWREAWQNWTRSLPMHDRYNDARTLFGLLEVALAQALPLPLFLLLLCRRPRARGLLLLNGLGLSLRVGVLWGTARAYRRRPWTYWLSPLCDIPVIVKLGASALQRRHTWRGRLLIRGGAHENS